MYIILARLEICKLSILVCNLSLNQISKNETNLNKFVYFHTKDFTTKVYIMPNVGRPTKCNIFRRVRYSRRKGKRKSNYTYEPSITTDDDVDTDSTHDMVSYSLKQM